MRGFCLLLLALVVLGCSPFRSYRGEPGDDPAMHVVEDVPFYEQEKTRDCGPAALASVLAHLGHPMSIEVVRQATYDVRMGGTLLADMENFSRSLGFETESGSGDLAFLRASVDGGQPVIVLVDFGFSALRSPHYLVVFGYSGDQFLAHAGVAEAILLKAERLDRVWVKMNRLYLLVE